MIQIGASTATVDSPIEHLMACHRRIEQRLDTLVNAAGHLDDDRKAALDAIRKSLQFLESSGALHTEDEESSLFPRLRPKLSITETAFIDSLEAQHAEADSIYLELKIAVRDFESSPNAVNRYRQCAEQLRSLYRDHIRKEDEHLMTLAKQSLSQSEISDIAREMRVRRE